MGEYQRTLTVIVFWSVAGYGLSGRRLASDFVKRLANPVIKTNNINLSSFWTQLFMIFIT
jgi:hypothetical protein